MYRIMPVDIYSTVQLDAWLDKMAQNGWQLARRRGIFCKFTKMSASSELCHISNLNPKCTFPSDQIWKTLCRRCCWIWLSLLLVLAGLCLCNLYLPFSNHDAFARFLNFQSIFVLFVIPQQLCACSMQTGRLLSAHATRIHVPDWKLGIRKALHFIPLGIATTTVAVMAFLLCFNITFGGFSKKFCSFGKAVPTWNRIETVWSQQTGTQQEVFGMSSCSVLIPTDLHILVNAEGAENGKLYFEHTRYATSSICDRYYHLMESAYRNGDRGENYSMSAWVSVDIPEDISVAFSEAGIYQYVIFQNDSFITIFWKNGNVLIRLNATLETTTMQNFSDLVIAAASD